MQKKPAIALAIAGFPFLLSDRTFHLELDQTVHFYRVFHWKFFCEWLDEAHYDHFCRFLLQKYHELIK